MTGGVTGGVPVGDRPVRLAHLELTVPDPAATGGFLADGLGLGVERVGDVVEVFTDGPYGSPAPVRALVLRPGADGVRLREVVFEAAAGADLGATADRLRAAGADVATAEVDAVRFAAGGTSFALVRPAAMAHRPASIAHRPAATIHRPALPPSPLRPRRLGHVNVTTPEPAPVVRALTDGLGLRLSEQIGEEFFFLRIGTEHHNIGVRGGPAGHAHHVALEVAGWDSYRLVCDHLAATGHQVEYGPGRHGPGHNLFVYVRDPSSGLRVELFSDMAHIEDDAGHRPHRWELADRPRTVNRWGPGPPQSFLS